MISIGICEYLRYQLMTLVIILLFINSLAQSINIKQNIIDEGDEKQNHHQQQKQQQRTSHHHLRSFELYDPKTVESKQYEFYQNVHTSKYPAKAAGEWVYKPEEAFTFSFDHLQCLNMERHGNCYDADYWKKTDDYSAKHRYDILQKGFITNSPEIMNATDPWVWHSERKLYKTLSASDVHLYRERVRRILKNRTIFLMGDSVTRQWRQNMICELTHIIGFSDSEARSKVKHITMYTDFSEMRVHAKPFSFKDIKTSDQDFVVFNIGFHLGVGKMGSDWLSHYEKHLERALQMDFGQIPDDHIYFRTTPSNHFKRGFGNWNSESFKVGERKPNMEAEWSTYGGTSPEQPFQNLKAFETLLSTRENKKNRQFHIFDVAPMTLARGDTSYDGLHFCMPGPFEHWNRMLYHRIEAEMQEKGMM